MDDKKKKRLEKRSLKLISNKKICSFSELSKALKISKSCLYDSGLTKDENLKALIQENKRVSKETPRTKKPAKKTARKKTEKPSEKMVQKPSEDPRMRSFSEVQAKLFIYKAYKQKHYERLSECNKQILDRQIKIVEWILKIDDKEQA